ncbi:MAG: hypothetical protein J0L80_00925 [Chitinophagales bacterium]|nr:hypothetical protein [Chitinophagales bacterium]
MQDSLISRLFVYQKERFPLLVHLPLIAAFSFSVVGYSRACRGAAGFIDLGDYMVCVATNIAMFFMLRVSDEHKDKEDDARFRKYLPVPRGLISLKELRILAWSLFVIITALNVLIYPQLLVLYFVMMAYLALMRYEFFIPKWLKRHQVMYIATHMVIIPLADIYASSYDWKLAGISAPIGLLFFFGVSFLNGVILEVGRKLRVKETEEEGVVSYTKLWGAQSAGVVWIVLLVANFVLARIAMQHAAALSGVEFILNILFVMAMLPALWFVIKPVKAATKLIELMSLIWALGMYITLGSTPLLIQLSNG